jgi:hypothetical protein
MAHLFHNQAAVQFPRLWLMEFFCNLSLHAYVATDIPEQLSQLETFPQLVVNGGYAHYQHHTLADLERLYFNVGAQNYGWYQSQWHVAARHVYDLGGVEVLERLWKAFSGSNEALSDEQLIARLNNMVHPRVAQIMTEWPLAGQ